HDPTLRVMLNSLTGPEGTLLPAPSDADDAHRYAPTLYQGMAGLPYAFMLPNRPELALVKGTYIATFLAWSELFGGVAPGRPNTQLDVDVTFKRAKSEPRGGRVDLLLLVVSNSLFDAAAAPTDPALADLLEHAELLLAKAGLAIGDRTYR